MVMGEGGEACRPCRLNRNHQLEFKVVSASAFPRTFFFIPIIIFETTACKKKVVAVQFSRKKN